MKRILLIAFLSTALIVFAQGEQEHMKFKGIQIDGTLNNFVSEMKANGFEHIATQDGVAIFNGDFAGYKNCEVGVLSLKETNIVNTVAVFFPVCNDWPSIWRNYDSIKTMLIEKYGEPSECVEEFQTYSEPNSDMDRWSALVTGHYTYYTNFETDKGNILIEIVRSEYLDCRLKLQYWDKINTDAVRSDAMDDL